MEPRVGNKFQLGRKIGSGSFGEIYLGRSFLLIMVLINFFLIIIMGFLVYFA